MRNSLFKSVLLLFFSFRLFQYELIEAQVIHTGGVAFSIQNGTAVTGDSMDIQAGTLLNNGTINLTGSFKNAGTAGGNGIYNVAGDWEIKGTFNPDTGTVNFLGNTLQTITGTEGETFYNLTINNSGISPDNRIILLANIAVSGTFTFKQGNIETNTRKLFLSNPSPAALNYTSVTDSRITGKFERAVNTTGNYLFPIGILAHYRPVNLTLNTNPVSGSVLSEFLDADPGHSGLPLPDDATEVYEAFAEGYWSLTADDFSCTDYSINLNGAGFLPPITKITRVIKRQTGSDWLLDGSHNEAIGTVAYRNNLTGDISLTGTHFGLGRCRPLLVKQPTDTFVCNGTRAWFTLTATGSNPLSFEWQENQGSGWNTLADGGIYSGTATDSINLSAADFSLNGYQYRAVTTDQFGNSTTSHAVSLTVNDVPVTIKDFYVARKGAQITITEPSILANDTDFENDTLFAVLMDNVIYGTLTLNASGTFTYAHNNSHNLSDCFTYRSTDGCSQGNTDTVFISVLNAAPVFNTSPPNSAYVQTAYTYDIITNDIDNDPLTISCTTALPAWMTFSDNGNGTAGIYGIPMMKDTGSVQITITVTDGLISTEQQFLLLIERGSTNKNPVAFPDNYAINEDTPLSGRVMDNDLDPDQDALFTESMVNVRSGHGTYSINSSGEFEYTPDLNYFGEDTLYYILFDNNNIEDTPPLSDSGRVLISIVPVNDKPETKDVDITVNLEQETEICLPATDVDQDNVWIANILSVPKNGETYLHGSQTLCFDYSPDRSFFGNDSIRIEVCDDGSPTLCDTAIVRIYITHENPILINEGISPDGDDINDIWIIHGIEQYPQNEIKIFSRSGQLIFEANGYNNTTVVWEGNANRGLHIGNKVPSGTYFYFIKLSPEWQVFNGFIIVK